MFLSPNAFFFVLVIAQERLHHDLANDDWPIQTALLLVDDQYAI